jgi:hypothetical protein
MGVNGYAKLAKSDEIVEQPTEDNTGYTESQNFGVFYIA